MLRNFIAVSMVLFFMAGAFAADQAGEAGAPKAAVQDDTKTAAADTSGYKMDVLIKDVSFKKKITRGGFIAPILKYPVVGDYMNVFTGLRAAMLLDHRFALGVTGYFMPTQTTNRELTGDDLDKKKVHWKYGGPYFEYYFFPDKIAHLSLGLTVGAGWLSDEFFSMAGGRTSYFFALEPELNLYLNISKSHRLGIGASYLFTEGARLHGVGDEDIRNFSVSLFAQFGMF